MNPDLTRPTRLEVNVEQLAINYRAICRHVSRPVMPILKANAYGHGLETIAAKLEQEGAPIFGVAYVEEGIALRKSGIKIPILVLGGIVGRQIPLFLEHDLTLTASSIDKLQAIESTAALMGKRAQIHLKIDTGMERLGIHWYSAAKLLELSLQCKNVDIKGIYSHLACSEDLEPTRIQLERFEEVLDFYHQHSIPTPIRHLANSGAILQYPPAWLDLVRPGLLLYGVSPLPSGLTIANISLAIRWVSRVVYFKVVRAGSPISYGWTWTPKHDTRIITIPVGYGDGYFRAMSGQAEVLVGGRRCPVVGRICMDQLMVDLGPSGEAYNGDEVVLLGGQGQEQIHARELAQWAGTIPWEILTNIHVRVPREYSGTLA